MRNIVEETDGSCPFSLPFQANPGLSPDSSIISANELDTLGAEGIEMKTVAEHAWLLEFADADERRANARARAAAAILKRTRPEGLVDLVPAARSLLVLGSPAFDTGRLMGLEGSPALPVRPEVETRSHEIRMTWNGADLDEVVTALSLTRAAFRQAFLDVTFTVGFLGFTPGFSYLYGLPKELQLPRRRTPRLAVPQGSIAMAGPYVGIYPTASPGGWNLIATTAQRLFDLRGTPPFLLSPGDRVRFVSL
jgi:KipI family sensor histidine kinase inhibitor